MYRLIGRCMPLARVAVMMIILIAGLWPFNPFPHNDVSWVTGESGLRFGLHGIVWTDEALPMWASGSGKGCTLELWLIPENGDDQNTILAIATPEQAERFRMVQYGDEVLFQREILRGSQGRRVVEIEVAHAFHANRPVYLAIAGDETGTAAYVDGKLAGRSARFGLTHEDLEGKLYFGAAITRFATWQGTLKGIRVSGRKLDESEIRGNFSAGFPVPEMPAAAAETAAYWFREGEGSAARAQESRSPALQIPQYFTLPRKPVLSPPWKEFHANRKYIEDIALNIVGFMPLGFAFLPLFLKRFGDHRAVGRIVVFGFAVSLLIELCQAWIPSRSSGMTDLITNTTGTYLGALVCLWKPIQVILHKAGESTLRS